MKNAKITLSLLIISILLVSALSFSLIAAAKQNKDENRYGIQEGVKEKLREHNNSMWLNVSNKHLQIKELSDERLELITNKINAKTGLNLTTEDVKNLSTNKSAGQILRAYLSNGRWALVKIMPDAASEKAIERLNAKCEERNCTIELKEVSFGKGNESNKTRLAYEFSTEKDSRFLFLFKNKMLVKAQVDAETGEIIAVKRPWWSFMAKEKQEN